MKRRCSLIIIVTVLLMMLVSGAACSKPMPTSGALITPAPIQSNNSPSETSQPGVNPVVTTIPEISTKEAFSLIQNNKDNPDFIILDVRTPDEFDSGHLAKAVNLDYYEANFKSNLAKLDRNKEYLAYCRTGIRGAAATQIMLDLGFTKVHNLSGGIVQWISDGYPI